MRHIYVDESGTHAKDPFAVVAGVIVNVDRDYRRITARLAEVKRKYLGADSEHLEFHASEVWHTRKRYKKFADVWTEDVQADFICEVLAICNEFRVPVAVSWMKKDFAFTDEAPAERGKRIHWVVFCRCFVEADKWLSKTAPDEHASVKAENCDHMHHLLDDMVARVNVLAKEQPPGSESFIFGRQLTNIVDDIQFLKKGGSPLLQLADAFSWGVRACLVGHPRKAQIWTALAGDVPMSALIRDEAFGAVVLETQFAMVHKQGPGQYYGSIKTTIRT
jgi:hypothetical protein